MKLFDKMKEIESKAAPIEKWTGTANIPFYGHLDQPRPSLSKHEGTDRGKGMLHCDDLKFILASRIAVPKLLQALEIAMEALDAYSYDGSVSEVAREAVRKIEELNE